jgi:malate permease and related proteins
MDLLTILRSLGSVVVIFLLVGLGMFVDRKKWFPGESWKGLGSLVVNIAMPCSAFYYLIDGFTRDTLASAGLSMLVYAGAVVFTWAVSMGLAALSKVPQERRGVFAATAAFSNTVFIGVPMTQMLFGDTAVKFAFMAFLPNMMLFWTLGVHGIRRDSEPNAPAFAKGWALKLLNPTLVATLLALVFIVFDVKSFAPTIITQILTQTTKTAGYMVSPVALIYCGILLSSMGFKNLKIDRSHILSMLIRFVLSPLAAFVVVMLVHTPNLMAKVLIAQAAMPAMSQISIVSGLYKADAQYAATGFMLTTIASIAFIPIIMVLMELFVH